MGAQMKRIVFAADLHCGHGIGLTHPDFNPSYSVGTERYKQSINRRELWKFYQTTLEALRPIHAIVINGDAIEGKGEKTGGTELLTADRSVQADMAAAAILEAQAERIFMSYGTPYHVGASEDLEDEVAKRVKAEKIGGNDFLDVNGLIIEYRHFVGGSSVPHGRQTSLSRERLWNLLWAEWGEYPKAHVIIRSHVHYFTYCGGYQWLGIITPALQGLGTKFARRVSGTVDFGLIHFDVIDQEHYEWQPHVRKFARSRQALITV